MSPMHATPPRERGVRGGRAQVEERVLVAAQHLFAERGFRGVTVRDIATEAGVSHALVHRYLGSKEAILVAVVKRNEGPVLDTARSAVNVRDAVLAMFRELRTSRPDYLKLVARVVMDRVPFEASGHEFRAFQRLIELTEREVANGAESDRELPEPRVLAAAFTALAIGWTVSEDWLVRAAGLGDRSPATIEASLERVLLNMADGNLPPAVTAEAPHGSASGAGSG